ncbi:MAG TPA: ABC transporter permease [Gemmatimonadaceae bacterium]|nr:ABC transporter permease [Gemmatimonadaceae bacterium]
MSPRWLRYLRFVRPNARADVDEELAFHIEMRVQRNLALGMTAEQARADALDRFGDVARVRDQLVSHDTRKQTVSERKEYVSDFAQDLRFGWRSLRRAPAFAAAAVATLAIGIGANAAIFSAVEAIVLRPLPYAAPEQLVSLGRGSAGEFTALRDRLHSYSKLAAYVGQTHPIDDGEEAVRLEGAAITTNLLTTLGVKPLLGRDFTDGEGVLGNNTVLILSYGLWQRRFGGDPAAIGRRILLEGAPVTIVGVMPPDFQFPGRETQYWMPYAFNPANVGLTWAVGDKWFIGRLAPAMTPAAAQRELRAVWPSIRFLDPLWEPGPDYRTDATVTPLQDVVVGTARTLLWILFGCVLLVLVIGCVNVANLLLARATARERELSVRAALGGGRGRLLRQLVTESLLLSALGSALGVALAYGALRWFVALMPASVPRTHEIALNGTVLGFTALVGVVAGIAFGIIPALRATNVSRAATTSGRATAGLNHQRVAGLLVATEVALAVLLGVGSVLLVRSFTALRRVDPGFESAHVIAARVSPPGVGYSDPHRVTNLYVSLLDRLATLPGVQSAAAVNKLPMAQSVWGIAVRIEGQFEDNKHPLPDIAHFQEITPGYFETMGIHVLRGRPFSEADREDQAPVTIVSESVARHFWPGADAIGKRIGYAWDSPWLTVVGIVADVRQDSLRDTAVTSMYVPWQQRSRMSGNEMWLLARSTGDPGSLASAMRGLVRETDRAVPVSDVRTMETVVADSVQKARFTTLLVAAFALAALLLGAVGIYGVMSYLVAQRTREMGIRLALGATARDVTGLVVRRGAVLATIGAAAGIIASFAATRALASLLFGVSARDPITLALVPLLFLIVAVIASAAPAVRAARVNPVRALRAD